MHEDAHAGREMRAAEQGVVLGRRVSAGELAAAMRTDSRFFRMGAELGQAQRHRGRRDFFLQDFSNSLTPPDYLKSH